MALKLQLCFLVLFVRGSVAVSQWTLEGMTLTMTCRIRNAARSSVEWRNPNGHVMFFNDQKALRDKRYKIINLSETDFSISVSDVTFKDGGLYTCLHYNRKEPVKKIFKVTVLGKPKLEVTEHNGKTVVKCSASANSHPPRLSWMVGSGIEIDAQFQPHYLKEKDTYSSMDIIHIMSHKRKAKLKCIVRHPAFHPLMDFVTIEPKPTAKSHLTTKAPHSTSKQNEVLTTTASHWPSPQVSKATTAMAKDWSSTRGSQASTPYSQVSTQNLSSLSQTKNTPYNGTGSNSTNARGTLLDGTEKQSANKSTHLFIFLVTCLIFGLLIVVVFFGIKLRRAHLLWKKENEDSDQSVESSKSKSSNEEKKSRGRRVNGLFNTGFTKYVVEEPMTTETNTTSMTKSKTEEAPVIQVISQTNGATQSSQIKETEL